MTSSKLLKNWSLGFKLNVILILVLVILLAVTLVILDSSMRSSTLQMGQRSVEKETAVIQSHFEEAEQEILNAAKLLAATPSLAEAVTNSDASALRTIIW